MPPLRWTDRQDALEVDEFARSDEAFAADALFDAYRRRAQPLREWGCHPVGCLPPSLLRPACPMMLPARPAFAVRKLAAPSSACPQLQLAAVAPLALPRCAAAARRR